MIKKNFAKDLEDYVGLINMRLVDISIDIQDLSKILSGLSKELEQVSKKLKVKK